MDHKQFRREKFATRIMVGHICSVLSMSQTPSLKLFAGNNLVIITTFYPHHTDEIIRGTDWLSSFPKVTQLSEAARSEPRQPGHRAHTLNYYYVFIFLTGENQVLIVHLGN